MWQVDIFVLLKLLILSIHFSIVEWKYTTLYKIIYYVSTVFRLFGNSFQHFLELKILGVKIKNVKSVLALDSLFYVSFFKFIFNSCYTICLKWYYRSNISNIFKSVFFFLIFFIRIFQIKNKITLLIYFVDDSGRLDLNHYLHSTKRKIDQDILKNRLQIKKSADEISWNGCWGIRRLASLTLAQASVLLF